MSISSRISWRYSNPHSCRTEYWLVEEQVFYDDWQISGAAVDCASTSSCANVEAKLGQNCDTLGWYAGVSVSAAFEKDIKLIKSTGTVEISGGANGNSQACTTESSSTTCTWSDKSCHTIWKASRRVQVRGYMRRRCAYRTASKPIPISLLVHFILYCVLIMAAGTQIPHDQQVYTYTGRGDGAYTAGIQGFDFTLPAINPIIGCAATCGQTNYPDPKPKPEDTITISGWK